MCNMYEKFNLLSIMSHSFWLGGCMGQNPLSHERVLLDSEMEAEVLGYQMRLKSSRESDRLKSYSHAKLQL